MKVAKKPAQLPYDELMQFNQHCAAALDLIESFGQQRMIPSAESRYYRALLQELRLVPVKS